MLATPMMKNHVEKKMDEMETGRLINVRLFSCLWTPSFVALGGTAALFLRVA